MIEYLSTNLLWWHWIVLGIILVVGEIFAPLFIILWFGLAAIVVGIIDLTFHTAFITELLLWILLSSIFLALWILFFKEKTITKSGQSDFTLSTKGVVLEAISPNAKGKVRFQAPVLGDSIWHAISDEEINVGEGVNIVEVNGQLIKVKKEA